MLWNLLYLVVPLALGAYVWIIVAGPHWVADTAAPPPALRLAHRAGTSFVGGCLLLCLCNWWTLQQPLLFAVVLLGSGLAAGVRGRLRGAAPWLRPLALLQAVLTPLALLPLGLWVGLASHGAAYRDAATSVDATQHFSLLRDDQNYPMLVFYRTRLLLFEEEVGQVGATDEKANPEWWRRASYVALDADSCLALVYRPGAEKPVRISFNPANPNRRVAGRP